MKHHVLIKKEEMSSPVGSYFAFKYKAVCICPGWLHCIYEQNQTFGLSNLPFFLAYCAITPVIISTAQVASAVERLALLFTRRKEIPALLK